MPTIRSRSISAKPTPKVKEIDENDPVVRLEHLDLDVMQQFEVPVRPESAQPRRRYLRTRSTVHPTLTPNSEAFRTPEKSAAENSSRPLRVRNTIHPTPNSSMRAPRTLARSLRFLKTAESRKPSGRTQGPLRVKNTILPSPCSSPRSRTPKKVGDSSTPVKPTPPPDVRQGTPRTHDALATEATSLQGRTRTPRTCKDLAMAKILQCYAELSLSPKSRRLYQFPSARKHTEKDMPVTTRRKSPASSSSDSTFSPSEDEPSEDVDEGTSSEEGPGTSSCESDSSEVVWSNRRRVRRQTVRRAPRTPASQAFVPRRTTDSAINRDTLNAKLHASCVSSDCLPCREQEFDAVFEFLFEHLQNRTGGCMYISGVPGTGKTATVNAVAKAMADFVDEGGNDVIPSFDFVTVNGMQISEPRQVYVQIYEALKNKKISAHKAMSLLEAEFCSAPHQRLTSTTPACVLLLDELDLLCSKRQDLLYALFDWACRAGDKKKGGRRPLIVLAIANTMDLPERVLHHRVASRLGLNRLAFAPYTHDQLAAIVNAKLGPELGPSFEAKAIELATRKVAAVSGDARRALDICRRAAEMAQLEGGKMFTTTMQHVNAALQEMFTSPALTALRCVSHYERLLLRAIVSEVAARGVEEVILYRCLQQLYALCNLEGVPRPSDTEVFAMCASLGAYKLIMTEPSRRDTNMLLRLNCSQSDVLFALKATAA